MKKILLAGACLVALASSPVRAQTSKPDVVVVRVSDTGSVGRLVIVREGGKTEEVEEFASGVNMKGLSLSGTLMQQVFGKLYAEGYTLKGTFGGSQGYVATLVFAKGQ
ncbi:MAG: hypothetical protein ACRYFZ_16755 [Janthinobacterium lividum]